MSSTNFLLLLEFFNIRREQQKLFQKIMENETTNNERLYNILSPFLRNTSSTIFTSRVPPISSIPTIPVSRPTQTDEMTGILSNLFNISPPQRTTPRMRPRRQRTRATTFRTTFDNSRIPTQAEIEISTIACKFRDISTNEVICPIGRDDFNPDDDILRIIYCRHFFKKAALEEWFRTHSTCPVCRHNILPQ